mmetsp:Transcript_3782/g.8296  ORF Transcript_3782/g.8296 Transcript_3782/m.8296 type:complete len:249 (-) Transcript_3782:402-1148(-)
MRSTAGGMVAENIKVWRYLKSVLPTSDRSSSGFIEPAGIASRIACTCGSKPMSIMRSASSSTRYVARRRLVALVLSMSISRPGVPTAISAPRRRSSRCSFLEAPPYTPATATPHALENLRASVSVCWHSSRVGASTTPMGPSFSSSSGWSRMCASIGRRNAAVLPDPVLAMPSTSLPLSAVGSAWHWIGVGAVYPCRSISLRRSSPSPHCANVLIGRGTSSPMTRTSSWRRYCTTSVSVMAKISGSSS